jgi:hypothetical protein
MAAVIGFLLLIAGLSGCGGGARIMGRLDYTDPTHSTAGDSIWVQLQGQEQVGATVTVKADNTWVYQPEGKDVRAWQGDYPPVKKAHKTDDDPVLRIQALTPTHRTKVQLINYVELKRQSDKVVRLLYEKSIEQDTATTDTIKKPLRGGDGPRP